MELSVALKVFTRMAREAGVIRLPDIDKIDHEVRCGINLIEGIVRSVYGDASEYWQDPEMQETYRGLLAIRSALDAYKKERAIINARVMHTTPIPPYEPERAAPPQPKRKRAARQRRRKTPNE
jgi:hypothetical protein